MLQLNRTLLAALLVLTVVVIGGAQTAGLGLRPMRLEIEALPGDEKTASFLIESPPSDVSVVGRLVLSLSDWSINEDTSVTYTNPGSQPNSATTWITFSPTDLTISSGQSRLVRVTARVPPSASPGVYTSAIFVQERPPTTAPRRGEQLVYFRYRYVETVYVIVLPVQRYGELTDARVTTRNGTVLVESELSNRGTRHLRPHLRWSLRSSEGEIVAVKDVEATVLLPSARVRESMALDEPLKNGEYELEVQADFLDSRPIQSIKRVIVVENGFAN